ncbi:5-oxoprolinase subunit PxpB [Neobacillus sp. D3-1R]|uniref:5-oxoprolinase subunit PxpB n=1 Tax=Neobacillus sp. D3-1R TaxID=3445778 RepID=UPI003F9FD913
MEYSILPLSEDAILIQFGSNPDNLKATIQEIQQVIYTLQAFPFDGFREVVPAYNTITVYYNPFIIKDPFPYQYVKKQMVKILHSYHSLADENKRYFEIPVCYEGEFSPDLDELAKSIQITKEEIIQLHTKVVYDVVFIGFAPGFPFLYGLDEKLFYPRKTSPRLKVSQGSVGIAGKQTGIYPLDSPGGWQIIGRTPVKLFNFNNKKPTLFQAGDRIKFYPITLKEYFQWEDKPWE